MNKRLQKSTDGSLQQGELSPFALSPPLSRSKAITINDIAKLAGVSKKTVSRVINEVPSVNAEIRERVNEVIKKTAFKPNPHARGLAFRKSFLIAMIYDNPNAAFIVGMQAGILEVLKGTGFELLVHQCDRHSPQFIADVREFVESQQPHGVVLLPPISENAKLIEMLHEVGCPHAVVAAAKIEGAMHGVISNDRDACVQVAQHLSDLGHTRIAIIAGPEGHRSARERLSGFEAALKQSGLQLPQELIAHGRYTFESGIEAGHKLLTLPKPPTAIFATNDEMAAGVYLAAHKLGVSIPDELSIVGYDDNPIASRLWPALTTVCLPIQSLAKFATLPLIKPETTSNDTAFVVPNLITRDSTAKPHS